MLDLLKRIRQTDRLTFAAAHLAHWRRYHEDLGSRCNRPGGYLRGAAPARPPGTLTSPHLTSPPGVYRPEESSCDSGLDPARLHRLLLPHRDSRPCGRLPHHLSAAIVSAGQVQQALPRDDPGGEAASNR